MTDDQIPLDAASIDFESPYDSAAVRGVVEWAIGLGDVESDNLAAYIGQITGQTAANVASLAVMVERLAAEVADLRRQLGDRQGDVEGDGRTGDRPSHS